MEHVQDKKQLEEWISDIAKSKEGDVDLSRDEDLSIALMNLVSLEEHFYFTAMKTDNQKYLELMKQVRDMRKRHLAIIVKDPKGEEWCISKHLLAASMRLYEVGVKELSTHGSKHALIFFEDGFELWSLFFAINMGLVGEEDLKNTSVAVENTAGVEEKVDVPEKKEVSKFSALMKRIVNCCKEW